MSTALNPETEYPFFFTWKAQRDARPINITGGSGAYFETDEGESWLDLGSLIYQANIGHGNTRVMEAVKKQAEEFCLSLPQCVFPAKVELAERLLEKAPDGFSKVFFTLGGSEAIENALKIARLFTGRHKLISRYRSYHGASFGALTLTGDWRRPPMEPGLAGVVHAMPCFCREAPGGRCEDDCGHSGIHHIAEVLEYEGPGTVAAVVVEPIPGANGVLIPPPGYLPAVREACDRHGTLLIADEVLTGFGRTGKWFAYEHFGATPDIIAIGKGLTGGYGTLGAVMVHDRIARFFDDQILYAGLTGYAHPLACAAALESIKVYEDEQLIERAAKLESSFIEGLESLRSTLSSKKSFIRSLGLLGILEIEGASDHEWAALQRAVDARKLHLHLRPRVGGLMLAPPLIISKDDLEKGFSLLRDSLGEAMNS